MSARHAALVVCGRAHTTDDAALLLDALGLVADGQVVTPPAMVDIPVSLRAAVVPTGARTTWRNC